jgi:acyl-coenzyme A thioesterase PaaI-like protein
MSAGAATDRTHDPQCMGCGPENPDSLGVTVRFTEDRVHGTVTFDHRHGGAPGFVHGGALAAVMDDLLGNVLILIDRPGVTATMTVDYRGPALLGRALRLEAWCEKIDGRKLHLRGEVHDGDTLIAEGRALFIHVDISHWEGSGQPLPSSWHGWGDSSAA